MKHQVRPDPSILSNRIQIHGERVWVSLSSTFGRGNHVEMAIAYLFWLFAILSRQDHHSLLYALDFALGSICRGAYFVVPCNHDECGEVDAVIADMIRLSGLWKP
jgi:hypothetical protein